jgi:hypothetical protein
MSNIRQTDVKYPANWMPNIRQTRYQISGKLNAKYPANLVPNIRHNLMSNIRQTECQISGMQLPNSQQALVPTRPGRVKYPAKSYQEILQSQISGKACKPAKYPAILLRPKSSGTALLWQRRLLIRPFILRLLARRRQHDGEVILNQASSGLTLSSS